MLRELISCETALILDGATASNLLLAGMPSSVCPEMWILDHPDVLAKLQEDYIEAGSHVLCAPTFGANRAVLSRYGLEGGTVDINKKLAEITLGISAGRAYVLADISPTGLFLKPFGDSAYDEIFGIYREQAQALSGTGIAGFFIETQTSLAEARIALLAIRSVSDLPVFAAMTIGNGGYTLSGDSLRSAAVILSDCGVDAFGCNCSYGPREMYPYLADCISFFPMIPYIAKANAGTPDDVEGIMSFRISPDEFARSAEELLKTGVSIIGGCCGTDPSYIRAVTKALEGKTIAKSSKPFDLSQYAATIRKTFVFDTPPSDIIELPYSPALFDDLLSAEDSGKPAVIIFKDEFDDEIFLDAVSSCGIPLAFSGNELIIRRAKQLYPGKTVNLL